MILKEKCNYCIQEISMGFGRCYNCGKIRNELRSISKLISDEKNHCVLSGALCDIKFPNGDWVWAEYITPFIDDNWVGQLEDHSEEVYKRWINYKKSRK